jgi:hypothetical protein
MLTANNYIFRPLTCHCKVVHTMKRAWGLYNYDVTEVTLYILQPQHFSLCVQPDDDLLKAETCSC